MVSGEALLREPSHVQVTSVLLLVLTHGTISTRFGSIHFVYGGVMSRSWFPVIIIYLWESFEGQITLQSILNAF